MATSDNEIAQPKTFASLANNINKINKLHTEKQKHIKENSQSIFVPLYQLSMSINMKPRNAENLPSTAKPYDNEIDDNNAAEKRIR